MNHKSKVIFSILLALAVAASFVALASAGTLAQGNNPVVIINRPPSSSSYVQGDIISIESVSASPVGIVEVELLVDGQVVQKDQVPGDLPQVQFSLIQRWIGNIPGNHVITVRATDSENQVGQAAINITVSNTPSTPIPAPTVAPPTPTPFTCVLNSQFVRDVTIPDNTVLAPGATFIKTWRIRNNGTCAWDPATVAVFVKGARMAGGSPAPVGAVQPGAEFDLTIHFVAPGSPGTYRSDWKMQSGGGVIFGEAIYTKIIVPGPPTPIPPPFVPTAIPPPPPPPNQGCQGTPIITSFTVDNGTIQKGQETTLRWGQVLNADSAFLQSPDGSGGIATPGQRTIHPKETRTYILAAFCKGVQAQQQITVNVQGGGGGGGGAQGSINSVNATNQNGRISVRVYYTWNGAGGPAQVCASAEGTDSRPCTNARANAPFANLNIQGGGGRVTACLQQDSGANIACGTN